MKCPSVREAVSAAMQRISRTWLGLRPDDLVPLLHPDMRLVFPGFAGRVEGREGFVAGFADFCGNATVHEYREANHQADVIADTAVVSFNYQIVYERSQKTNCPTSPALWVFVPHSGVLRAVFR